MAITDYNTSAALNTSISGIPLPVGATPRSSVSPAIRQLMADMASANLGDKLSLNDIRNVRIIMGITNPEAYVIRLDSAADAKQVDGLFVSSVMQNGGSGYPVHGIMTADATIGADAAGGGGFAADGVGNASGVVGNRQGVGPGNGVQGARLGSGAGAGVEARASSTGECYAVRGIKQNPTAGTAGTGPAVFAINDSTNGQAIYARSASANTDSNTVVLERLNGSSGTVSFARVPAGGARTALLKCTASHIVPATASTGTFSIMGHDTQINSNVTGSADVRGLNIAVNSTTGTDAYGMVAVVDGVNTTNYGLYVNAANGTTNYGLYVAGGQSYFAGNVNTATQYQVADTKVVGARGAALPADATDLATAITLVNAIKARMVEHGLVA